MARLEAAPECAVRDSLGVLVVNLGTPEAPTPAAVRRYLTQFLSDPRVVELPRWLWWPVLYGYILRVRPARSAVAYRKVWTTEGSPLLVHTTALAESIREKLSTLLTGKVIVRPAMSYGQPSIRAALDDLFRQGVTRIVVLPLYPQYSSSTSGSVFEEVTRLLSRRRFVPGFRFVSHYYDSPGYVEAVAASIREFRQRHGGGERLLFSFHGLPLSMVEKGDPYYRQCLESAQLVAEALGLPDSEWRVSFQSRVGREEWLRPYTDETLQQWGEQRMGKIDVACPGFAVDCLETLEEIAMQNAERFRAAGGGELRYIPALNTRDDHSTFLSRLIADDAGADT
jgi:ferrochelatase